MPCYHPMVAYKSKEGPNPNGKWPIVFNVKDGYIDKEVSLPCGKCIGCRLEYSRQWAIRCLHESKLYEENCFITLTYDNDNLPKNGSLVKRDFQLFMKKLRKKYGSNIRFYQCGEYGEENDRPHYHACIFNFDFEDKRLFKSKGGTRLYVSESLGKLWPYGMHIIGEVTFESAAYVARYITKKITGEKAEEHYKGRLPEYVNMSRRPGIGSEWYNVYQKDVHAIDGVIIRNGLKVKPPKYYDKKYDLENPEKMLKIKIERKKKICEEENTFERLKARELHQQLTMKQLKRS